MKKLKIINLHVEVEGKKILKGVNLEINPGETFAILGPNGHGKSTLLNVIMGHPKYKITEGSIFYGEDEITNLSPDEKSKKGIFLAMQYPSEVPGVVNADFLKSAVNAHQEKPVSLYKFYNLINKACEELGMPMDLANRFLNEGFSGGEKKRNEILQMMMLSPSLCMLDEIDSGLDVDAIQLVSKAINSMKEEGRTFLIVSHYARLYNLISPTKCAIIVNGKIALEGGPELIERIDKEGYEFLKIEHGINIEKEDSMSTTSIGTCATREALKK